AARDATVQVTIDPRPDSGVLEVQIEPLKVETQALRVAPQVVRFEPEAVAEQPVVHLPKLPLARRRFCRFCRSLGVRMNLSQREIAEHELEHRAALRQEVD